MPTMPTPPPYEPSNPSGKLSWVERAALTYTFRRITEMNWFKGYRTMVINGLMLGAFLLTWGPLATLVDPQYIAMATTVINLGLRYITTTPVGTPPPTAP